ncbi:MAG: hypothetical protein FVQ85_03280 [Planctomycetes bacterium]|nr:hypothetical protein [Planctomycetota bacterium]
MKRLCWLIGLLVIGVSTGCNSDIVTNPGLKKLDHKCVYLSSIESDNPNVGKVIKNIIEKEFMRKKIELCDFDTATVLITGAAFMTARATSSGSFFGRSSTSTQAIESVSVVAKDRNGQVLLSASYDNRDRYSASKLAREFGSALADKLK